jgi:hypothetical protein
MAADLRRGSGCCGRSRAAEAASSPARSSSDSVRVVYLGARAVQFRGESGAVYRFGPVQRRGMLAAVDLAAALVRGDFMQEPE